MDDKDIFLNIEQHILNDEKPSDFFYRELDKGTLHTYPFSMIEELNDVPQNPKFHPEGNVFIHTMMVVDEGAKNRNRSKHKRAFMWALLLHDIGKKPTTKMRKGRMTSYNHDVVGERMAREFLEHFNEEQSFIDEVSALVRWHMQSLFVTKDMKFQNMESMLKEVDIDEIVLVALCDRLGRGRLSKGEIQETKDQVNYFEQKLRSFKKQH
ncbi:HDIG domain-containing metalloprotein [Clostridium saccharobutylicum]|uniref:Putative domain HDIG-containing protein n=2 Tax=Clostridium saccharobutylicum TaxID=169679 RepID=U5N0X9_CLOSA|nr:HD domain-containing protein [Clostridium saccharobutylicum]AGX45407.1 putative domain HDIG-containing protein [Clostridium saccharobutylicum DSM 13864]AQR92682.1 multifunctional CCA protein [Clostridium saccharobutylicum]AQS02584.1 multifunctional CCA protein [Clostridium saccharobutylicum]AQS12190.1 multifunctional CCA protein [Clostridium saccharobutylicum]AQS16567.1 multifunctional CCA protein [Clostridium saccharobutylicum]